MDQIYEIRWWDLARLPWCAKFYVPDYSGSVEILKGSGKPVVIDYQNSDDDFSDPMRPSEAKIEIKVDENWKFNDLFSPNIMYCWVEIYQGVDASKTLFFRGWVDPSKYEEPYGPPPYYLTITVVDGLSYLQDIMFAEEENSDGTYEYYDDRALESEILWDIFNKIGVIEYNEYINLFAVEMASTTANTPLNQVLLDRDRFFDMSCYEVLAAMLGKYRAVLRMNTTGIFEIYRPVDLRRGIVYGRHWTSATASSPVSMLPTQYIYRTATHLESALRQIPGGVQIQVNPAKRVNINQEYGSKESWLNNFTLNQDSYDIHTRQFEEWESGSYGALYPIPISDIVPGEEEGVALRRYVSLGQVFGQYALAAPNTEQFKIEFEYGFFNRYATPRDNVVASFQVIQTPSDFSWTKMFLGKSSAGDTLLVWASTSFSFPEPFSVTTPELDEVGYGWSGWKSISYTFKGIPYTRPLTIFLQNTYSDNVYVCFRNVKFSSSSVELSKITYQRSFWERFYWNRSSKLDFFLKIDFHRKYTLKDKYSEVEHVTEYTYKPICDVDHGSVLDYDFILGDIVKESTPSNKGDTKISNNLEQFAGSLAIMAREDMAKAAQTYISTYSSVFQAVGVTLEYDENSAGISMILFKAAVAGVDFSGAAAASGSETGDVDGVAYTITTNLAGTRRFVELTITGSSGYVTITINGVSRDMTYYAESIEESIQHFVDLYAYLFSPVEISIDSTYNALQITGDEEGNDFTYSTDDNGLTATLSYDVECSPLRRRVDAIELTGTNGTAALSCCGVSRTLTFGFAITMPSSEWSAGDDSSDAFPHKPLLQIIGDELAAQYSRTKYIIQMPILERITGSKSGLNLNGCIIDTENKDENGDNRVFVINRGSFDTRNRMWELDLVELLPYEGYQPEIIPPALPSFDSSEDPSTPAFSSEDFGVALNHIDTIASGRYGQSIYITYEYTAAEARTGNLKYYFSSDAAGELATTVVETVAASFTAGTHTAQLIGVVYPSYTSKYLHIYLEDDTDEFISSNSFDCVLITLNSISSISSPQYAAEAISPNPTFNTTTQGGSLTVTIYWNIRSSSNATLASGSQDIAFSTGTSDKSFSTTPVCPTGLYEDCTFGVGFSELTRQASSNQFDIEL